MFINNFDPVAFSLLSIEIRWYSLAYIFGIVIGWIYIKKFLIKDDLSNKHFDDLISYLIIGIIVGGRLGYVVFYNFDYYWSLPLKVFYIWEGGMSFHGGLVGVIVSTFIFSRKNNLSTFLYLDCISVVAPIGIFFGRIANFLNSELYGKETAVPWGIIFQKVDNIQRHPSQIYEAFLEGLLLFVILSILAKKNFLNKNGFLSSIFLILYSVFRFITEFFREPDIQLGYLFLNFSMGQILTIFLFFLGIIIFVKNENK